MAQRGLTLFLAFFFILGPVGGARGHAAGGPEDAENLSGQQKLAMEYRSKLARTPADEAEGRELLYLAMIEECPDTDAAQEALWALGNLYLDGFDEPREAEAQEALEYFMRKYPDSPWIVQVENRLCWLYEGTESHERALALYEKMLRRDMPSAVRLPLQLRCAQAYENASQPGRAGEWYARIVKEYPSGGHPEVAAAKSRLAALNNAALKKN